MATLLLSTIGAAVAGPFGQIAGSLVGRLIDQQLFGGKQVQEGPRLRDLEFAASTEGAGMARVWGRMRVSPQVIWATRFREERDSSSVGGKGGAGVERREYSYYASFALGLCEGPIAGIGRAWADGKYVDLSDFDFRLYYGTEDQTADPLIAEIEGADRAPGFRGTAYIVFEDMPLERFGNRPPQLTIEVFARRDDETRLPELVRAVMIGPGAGEFGYGTTPVFEKSDPDDEGSERIALNMTVSPGKTDFQISLDRLQAEFPKVETVGLVICWHGDNLRCGDIAIRPRVESADRATEPYAWRAGETARGGATVLSTVDGKPAFGGAPSDRSVVEAIAEIKARGLEVTLVPMILMDVPPANGLSNPWTAFMPAGAPSGQTPWPSHMLISTATALFPFADATAATQIAEFFGTADAADFGWDAAAQRVTYAGPDEWSYRRFVLHVATLADAAGGVDRFLIGKSLRGLTLTQTTLGTFPAVARLVSLAAEARAIVGSATEISYAADWTEFHSFRFAQGTGAFYFPLDPLWADAEIDFVGIDFVGAPLADWRDGTGHLDALAGAASDYDLDYLRGQVEGGEFHAYTYDSAATLAMMTTNVATAARTAQTRTAIADAALGKHWMWRQKDIASWWGETHRPRSAPSTEIAATAWVAEGKPIVFTALGCRAIDKGANFHFSPLALGAAEDAPAFTTGLRDDQAQRAFIEAALRHWRPSNGNNPTSAVYSAPMIDWERSHVWRWDARPSPEFPNRGLWADGPDWPTGRWVGDRATQTYLADVVADLCAGFGIEVDASPLVGMVTGFRIEGPTSPRDALRPLMTTYLFDSQESGETLRFHMRGGAADLEIDRDDLAARDGEPDWTMTRLQESELPREIELSFHLPASAFRPALARATRLSGASIGTLQESVPLAFPEGRARRIVAAMLADRHAGRERVELALPPSALALDAADRLGVTLPEGEGTRRIVARIEEIGLAGARAVRAVRERADAYEGEDAPETVRPEETPQAAPPPRLVFLDIPLIRDEDEAEAHSPKLAAFSSPWAPVRVLRAPSEGKALTRIVTIARPAAIGATVATFPSGTTTGFDDVSDLDVRMPPGVTLPSADEEEVLEAGANMAAVEVSPGRWEILQWTDAELIDPWTFRLTHLRRGLKGSDADMVASVAAGAVFVRLDDGAVVDGGLSKAAAKKSRHWVWGPADRPTTDPRYQSATLQFDAIGLRPLAPVDLAGVYAGGDLTLSWTRRSRLEGDPDAEGELPLGEARERYRVRILDGATVVRTWSNVGQPSLVYAAAEIVADWGTPPATVDFRVEQWSAEFGFGAPAEATATL